MANETFTPWLCCCSFVTCSREFPKHRFNSVKVYSPPTAIPG